MRIQNGLVFEEDRKFRQRDVWIRNGRFCTEAEYAAGRPAAPEEEETIDAEGMYVIPGLVDVHLHGAAGADFSDGDPEGWNTVLAFERANGVTSCCPAVMSLPAERIQEICALAGKWESVPQKQARMLGLHLEGPFLSPQKKGAQNEAYLRKPDREFLSRCISRSANRIRLVTIAPELEGAAELIEAFRGRLVFSLGHTQADYRTAKRALEAGADHITHLFNAMMPFAHRSPDPAGAAMDTPGCMAELICDGVHVHESMVRAAFALFPGRIVLVSDSMRAAGLSDGVYELGGQQVSVHGKKAVLSDGTLAGSVSSLMECLRKAVSFGIPKEAAVAAATADPAKSIGMYDQIGSVSPGKYADLLLLDRDFRLVRVITGGRTDQDEG